jgi:hypothetical protein
MKIVLLYSNTIFSSLCEPALSPSVITNGSHCSMYETLYSSLVLKTAYRKVLANVQFAHDRFI